MNSTVALIQARMSSSRLPGKILADLGGLPMICFMIERVKRAKSIDKIAVVTSTDASDDVLVQVLREFGVAVIRGPLDDVLKRYMLGAEALNAHNIIRLTGDCPLIDPAIIDLVVALHSAEKADYSSNIDPPGFADGMDSECFTRALLDKANRDAQKQPHREHVTLWMREAAQGISRVNLAPIANASHLRLTVDYEDDLYLVRDVVSRLGDKCDYFDILRLFQHDKTLSARNPHMRNETLNNKCSPSNIIHKP